MTAALPEVEAFAAGALADGLTDVYLLGMGGSSLCAEVLRDVPLARPDRVQLTVLDTTDERTIHRVTQALDPERALFIVASKSGSTIEVKALEQHFWSVMSRAVPVATGRHFVAITDPGTSLSTRAATAGYRQTFTNPPDIGGRYSALSLFGLVPAALVGVDIRVLLSSGREIAERCRANESDQSRPGARRVHGGPREARARQAHAARAAVARAARRVDRAARRREHRKERDRDPPGCRRADGPAVGLRPRSGVCRDPDARCGRRADGGAPAGGSWTPRLPHRDAGERARREFFRWEFGTAIAGTTLGVNPFDEPNVRDAKVRTQAQLDQWKATGTFDFHPPFEHGPGYARREHRPELPTITTTRPLQVDTLPCSTTFLQSRAGPA